MTKWPVLLLLLCFSTSAGIGQNLDKVQVKRLLQQVADDKKAIEECDSKAREVQIERFGKPLPKISGHCWDGCPTFLPKPHYPEAARRLRAKGEVVVAAVADESGKVVFARIVNGNKLFRRAALEAAYKATHTRKIYCERPVKFWWTIRYMFHPDM